MLDAEDIRVAIDDEARQVVGLGGDEPLRFVGIALGAARRGALELCQQKGAVIEAPRLARRHAQRDLGGGRHEAAPQLAPAEIEDHRAVAALGVEGLEVVAENPRMSRKPTFPTVLREDDARARGALRFGSFGGAGAVDSIAAILPHANSGGGPGSAPRGARRGGAPHELHEPGIVGKRAEVGILARPRALPLEPPASACCWKSLSK